MIRRLLVLLVVAVVAPAQAPKKASEVDGVLAELKDALKAPVGTKVSALRKAARVDDAQVARQVGRYLRDPSTEVRRQAIRALRYVRNEAALEQLLKAAARKDIRKDEELMAECCLALGQHGDKKAVPTLVDHIFANATRKVFEARMAALAHIREKESVDALVKLLSVGGSRRRSKGGHAVKTVSAALFALTGQKMEPGDREKGSRRSQRILAWKRWWETHRATFEIEREPTWLRGRQQKQWEKLWTPPSERTRREARRERRRRGKGGGS